MSKTLVRSPSFIVHFHNDFQFFRRIPPLSGLFPCHNCPFVMFPFPRFYHLFPLFHLQKYYYFLRFISFSCFLLFLCFFHKPPTRHKKSSRRFLTEMTASALVYRLLRMLIQNSIQMVPVTTSVAIPGVTV